MASYRLGMKVLTLSRAALSGVDVRESGAAHHALTWWTRFTSPPIWPSSITAEAVYVEKVEAPSFIRMDTWIGRRMEVHSTAVGKALLAYLDPEKRDAILRQRGLKKLTPHTITSCPS